MKKALLHCIILAGVIVGCTAQNPNYTPIAAGQPDTNTVPKFIVDSRVSSVSNTATGLSNMTAPFNPYSAITGAGVHLLAWAFGLGSLAVAAWKNKQKGQALGALAVIAQGAIKAGPTVAQTIIDHSSSTDHFATIVSAINDATGVNQSSTGVTKS